ncbi:MAG: sigma-70 family RNA polymerase sigma factor [Planctomycetota bacterium]
MGSDAELTSLQIGRAVGGDDASVAWLIERFSPALLAQARYRLRGAMAAIAEPEDLVQDVWAITLPRLGDLAARDGRWTPVVLRFLTTTLLRRVHHLVRRRIVKPTGAPGEAGPEPEAQWSGIVTRLGRREQRSALLDAIDGLPADEREVLVLRGIEQLPNSQVAALIGAPDSTVTRRYQRALQHLRELLPGSLFEELD